MFLFSYLYPDRMLLYLHSIRYSIRLDIQFD
jgi:hypothetical protein